MNDELAEDREASNRPLLLKDVHVQAGEQVLLADTSVTIPGGKITVIRALTLAAG